MEEKFPGLFVKKGLPIYYTVGYRRAREVFRVLRDLELLKWQGWHQLAMFEVLSRKKITDTHMAKCRKRNKIRDGRWLQVQLVWNFLVAPKKGKK